LDRHLNFNRDRDYATDHVDPATWNRALPVDGGTYTITARVAETTAWSIQVTVAASADNQTVDIPTLPALAAQPAPSTSALGASGTIPDWKVLTVGGSALALGVVALALKVSSSSTYNRAKAEMSSQTRRESLYSSANTKYQLAQGFALGGIACAGAAVWLYVRARRVGDDAPARAALVVSPTGAGVAGTF
jgi:hypothetical protein